MPAATTRTSKLDHDLHQAQNSGKVNLSLLEILKLLKAYHSFKKHSLFFLMHWPYKNANISQRGSRILFPSSNEGAVANGHLWEPRATRASWEVGAWDCVWQRSKAEGERPSQEGRKTDRITNSSCAQGRPCGRGFALQLYFPWALSVITITAHWFSILSINTFIGHSDIIKFRPTLHL